jgi:hypothetical protein
VRRSWRAPVLAECLNELDAAKRVSPREESRALDCVPRFSIGNTNHALEDVSLNLRGLVRVLESGDKSIGRCAGSLLLELAPVVQNSIPHDTDDEDDEIRVDVETRALPLVPGVLNKLVAEAGPP